MPVTATVVKQGVMGSTAYCSFKVPDPAGGASIEMTVTVSTADSNGNPLLPAQVQASLQTAARQKYVEQFPPASAGPGLPPTFTI